MRWGTLLLVVALLGGACGDDAAVTTAPTTTTGGTVEATTTTATVAETTTTTAALPLTDPRFPATNLSARFALPDDTSATLSFDPATLLALCYRSVDGPLVVVLTGFGDEVPPVLQCGWILMRYGTTAVLDAPSWDTAPWDSHGNQPWATQNFGATRCEEAFLEDGGFRPDIATARECGDFLVVVADELAIDPAVVEAEVGTPFAEIIVDAAEGPVSLEAIPWEAHPGALQTVDDLLEIDVDAARCPQF
ncbi:MAG: hypothetical protein HZA58_04590 [Acidimicrobiia bacterium]|nr:hypothetical protein [Acidimicrobiia bacterium]